MEFKTDTSPHLRQANSVSRIMLHVLIALVPGALAMCWFFGWGILINIVIAILTAVVTETICLKLRHRPARPSLYDLTAVVTAVLLALALPPLAPWWLAVIGTAFALVFAKHLFGGLGYNPFNPAMVGYVTLLISFPVEMTRWIPPAEVGGISLDFWNTLNLTINGQLPQGIVYDALTLATPLDTMKTQLGLMDTLSEIRASALFGDFGGRGWEWVANWYFIGGMWLIYKRIITWHIPAAMLGSLFCISLVFYFINPDAYPAPLFHIFSGGAMIGAFFIATDPVSGCTSNKGRLLFAAGVGILTYIIRSWGGYPDGIAFAILLMNMAAPSIDYFTRPRVFGAQDKS